MDLGGHERAASALVKGKSGMMVFATLEEHLNKNLRPAVVAENIMITHVHTISDEMTLIDASLFLEKHNHSGAHVVTQRGELVGFMTLRDIMKGRKNKQMQAPVKGYMSKKLVTAQKDTTIREIEDILFQNNVGHLPIVHGKSLLGMVTRADFLSHLGNR